MIRWFSQPGGPPEGALEVDEKDDTISVGIVPDFVVPRVVKDEALAFLPGMNLIGDADAALLARLWDERAHMQTQDAGPGSAMGGDVLARGKDAEEVGGKSGDLVQKLHRHRATGGVLAAVHASRFEEECLPVVVCLDVAHSLHDVLEAWHGVAVLHDMIELCPPASTSSTQGKCLVLYTGGSPKGEKRAMTSSTQSCTASSYWPSGVAAGLMRWVRSYASRGRLPSACCFLYSAADFVSDGLAAEGMEAGADMGANADWEPGIRKEKLQMRMDEWRGLGGGKLRHPKVR